MSQSSKDTYPADMHFKPSAKKDVREPIEDIVELMNKEEKWDKITILCVAFSRPRSPDAIEAGVRSNDGTPQLLLTMIRSLVHDTTQVKGEIVPHPSHITLEMRKSKPRSSCIETDVH